MMQAAPCYVTQLLLELSYSEITNQNYEKSAF